MKYLPSHLLKTGLDAIPKQYQAEFWGEVLATNIRRIRALLLLAIPGLLVLLFLVQIRNVFGMTAEKRAVILTMQILILTVLCVFAGLFFARSVKSMVENMPYFAWLLRTFTVMVVVLTQVFIFVLLTTGGHPVFFYQILITWAASLLLLPGTAVFLAIVMFGGFVTTLGNFGGHEETRFIIESVASSAAITLISVVSSMILFRSAVREFRRRLALKEERNKVTTLNGELQTAYIETDTINHQLQQRQEVLEEQAVEIELINTQLHENNQRLQTLNEEKNEIIAIVAHDLKNPIAALRGLSEMLLHEEVEEEYSQSVLLQFATTTARMDELVKNLLDINQWEAGKKQLNVMPCDIAQTVEYAVQQYILPANEKSIVLHLNNEAPQTIVLADRQAFAQILDNLISNAVKYSPHGKNVFVRIKEKGRGKKEREEESSEPLSPIPLPLSFVHIEVQDEGPGISEEDMKKLFGKFARLSARPTGGEHSTGLGLSIVKKMVEAMKGKVWCESEVGKGARFIVELPKSV